MNRLWAGWSQVYFLADANDFSLLTECAHWLCSNAVCYSVGTAFLFLWVKDRLWKVEHLFCLVPRLRMNRAITVPLVYALMVWTGKALHLFALMPNIYCIYLYSICRMQSKLAVQHGRPSAYWPCCIDFLSQQICHSVVTVVFFKSLFRARHSYAVH